MAVRGEEKGATNKPNLPTGISPGGDPAGKSFGAGLPYPESSQRDREASHQKRCVKLGKAG
jgi:hypothetical protein